jgi:hypothetical protein
MASGHANRANRPNTWLHRPATRPEVFTCQPGAVHTWHEADQIDKWAKSKGQRLTLSRHPVRLRMPPTPTVLETNSRQRSFDRSSSVKISVAGLGWRRSGALGVSDGPQRFRHSATGKYSDVTAEERTKGRHSSVRHRHPGRPPGLTFVILEATFHLSRGDGALTSQAWTHIGTRVGLIAFH